jgi:hypothetical protein
MLRGNQNRRGRKIYGASLDTIEALAKKLKDAQGLKSESDLYARQ